MSGSVPLKRDGFGKRVQVARRFSRSALRVQDLPDGAPYVPCCVFGFFGDRRSGQKGLVASRVTQASLARVRASRADPPRQRYESVPRARARAHVLSGVTNRAWSNGVRSLARARAHVLLRNSERTRLGRSAIGSGSPIGIKNSELVSKAAHGVAARQPKRPALASSTLGRSPMRFRIREPLKTCRFMVSDLVPRNCHGTVAANPPMPRVGQLQP